MADPTDKDVWKDRIKKWRKGVTDISAADPDKLDEYIQTKIYEYTTERISDANL